MNIKQMTLAEFMCGARTNIINNPQDPSLILEGILPEMIGEKLKDLDAKYAIHQLRTKQGDVALVYKEVHVGVYLENTLAIALNHQGKELSTPMILEAIKPRPDPEKRKDLSLAGQKALEKAWYVAHGKKKCRWLWQ